MKYIVIIAVAVLSFIVAIPISKQPANIEYLTNKNMVKTGVEIKTPIKTSAKILPTVTHQTTQTVPADPPATTPAPAVSQPAAVEASFSCETYQNLFDQYNWNVATAMAICQAESSGNPDAIGCHNEDGVCDYGLMQIHGVDILDPAENIAYAYYNKYLTQGWGAWTTYLDGVYAQFL